MKRYFLILTVLFAIGIQAQEIPEKPNSPKLMNDFAGLISSQQEQQLEQALSQFARETSTQIAILTVENFGGTSSEDFAFKVGEKWGIGQQGKNNGIVVVIKPRIGNSRGQAFIATGYGLEGAVPDAVANRIIDHEMIPSFKKGDYFSGIALATNRLMELTRGEYTADEYMDQTGNKGGGISILGIVFFFAIVSFVMRLFGGQRRSNMGGSSLPFWLMMSMMGSRSSCSHSGSYGNFSSGSGGFGGGGFGGFGGGSFGGGGAGGSW
ncbi:TPM domain-containing protein [Carboxylicivirga marina]|uniref:TPM domain-containing protein n=1 Tax=Carboxylicivirga marina TaxID=2800988 RepID=A0ABS1HME0_9BACT|nr:TPM domain-containing protein [Carboxylicivirga marina]MBK3518841.1 TPM domain-containing protein [Carboxylicivirga marina]